MSGNKLNIGKNTGGTDAGGDPSIICLGVMGVTVVHVSPDVLPHANKGNIRKRSKIL